jgi:TetR/AcrR family transcriptional regulator
MPSRPRSSTVSAQSATNGTAPRDDRDRRDAILKAAVGEFSAKGYHGARVDAIAQKARSNKQLIYYYFQSKDGLYECVLEEMIANSNVRMDETGPHESVSAAVEAQIQGLLGQGGEWMRFWLWEALDPTPVDATTERDREKVWARWVGEFRRAQKRGEIDAGYDPRMLALAMNSIVVTPYMMPRVTKLITGKSPDSDAFKKQQLTLVHNFLKSLATI